MEVGSEGSGGVEGAGRVPCMRAQERACGAGSSAGVRPGEPRQQGRSAACLSGHPHAAPRREASASLSRLRLHLQVRKCRRRWDVLRLNDAAAGARFGAVRRGTALCAVHYVREEGREGGRGRWNAGRGRGRGGLVSKYAQIRG